MYMIAFSSFIPYFANSTYNFTSEIQKFNTFSSHTISKLTCKLIYLNELKSFWYSLEFDIRVRVGLLERGACLNCCFEEELLL